MKKFLGLISVTGIVQKPKLDLYWSTRGIFQTPIFSTNNDQEQISTYPKVPSLQ